MKVSKVSSATTLKVKPRICNILITSPALLQLSHAASVTRNSQWEFWRGSGGRMGNFSIKIMNFYAHFGQISYFKAITYQLKAFKSSLNVLNRINEVHVL